MGVSTEHDVTVFDGDCGGAMTVANAHAGSLYLAGSFTGTDVAAFYDADGRMVCCNLVSYDGEGNAIPLNAPDGDLTACIWKMFCVEDGFTPHCDPFTD